MTDDTNPEVRVAIDSAAAWQFTAPSPATTLSQVTAECVRRYEQLFEAFGEFITPTELQTTVEIHDRDRRLADVEPDQTARERNEVVLADETITPSAVAEATAVDGPGVPYVTQIRINHGRFRLQFDEGEKPVDRDDCILYLEGDPRPDGTFPGPLTCRITHYPSREGDPVETAFKSTIVVELHSDVWMGGGELPRVNRARLGAFLSELDDEVSAAAISRERYEWDDFWYDLSVTTDEWGRHTFDLNAIY